jgi:hypothetical protein
MRSQGTETVPPPRTDAQGQRVPRSFQLLLAAYIILTGDLPTALRALTFGLEGGVVAEFTVAMLTSFVLDVLLIAPIVVLARHPLGVLHPILIGVVLWPTLVRLPSEIQEIGGWAPVFLGLPVEIPFYQGLGVVGASTVWTAIAKSNALEILAVCSTYLGFALWSGRAGAVKLPRPMNPTVARMVLIGLVAFSTVALMFFIYYRGGVGEHLSDLGRGRFRSLAGQGLSIIIADLGVIAILLWLAIRPRDVRSPLFLLALGVVVFGQFVSNGSRSQTLVVLMLAGLVWALRVQRIPWRLALVLLPVAFLSIGIMNAVRTASWTGVTPLEALAATNVTGAIEKVDEEVRLRRSLSSAVPIVERGFQVSGGALNGRSYLAALVAFIPRSAWEDKPRGPGSLYAQMFLGTPREGLAIPVSAAAEAYWNFSLWGVVILFIAYGALLRLVYRFFWRRYPDPFAICFYALFTTGFKISTDNLTKFEQQFVLLLLAYMALKMFVPQVRTMMPAYFPPKPAGGPPQPRPAGG